VHGASACVCVPPLIQDKIVPVYTILGLSLKRDLSRVRCSWRRHSEERSTEDMVLLGAVLRVFSDSLSELARLGRRAHLMKRSETHPVMKMVMISGRGDGGGKEAFRKYSSSHGDLQRAQQF
jgi:hypothetical protein